MHTSRSVRLLLALLLALSLAAGCGGGGGGGGGGPVGGGGAPAPSPTPTPAPPTSTAGTPPAPPTLAVPTAGVAEYRPDTVLVKMKDSASVLERGGSNRGRSESVARRVGLQVRASEEFRRVGIQRLHVGGADPREAARRLSAEPEVEYAEPDFVVRALEWVPNDTYFNRQWGLRNTGQEGGTPGVDIGASDAWDVTRGDPSVVVGIIDSGVDYTHPDLSANMWRNPREVAGNGLDDDGNGVADDVHGFDAISGGGDPMDDHSHGTHVAGIVAATANNGAGTAGVAPDVRIMALRFMDATGEGYTSDAIRCIDYAIRMGVRVTNNSWGGNGSSRSLLDAMNRARASGMLFVVAAGNESVDNDATPSYPASYSLDNMLVVGSSTRTDAISSFSNWGATSVHLFAPGSVIAGPILDHGYGYKSGTSMAAPHVAGAVALLMSQSPGATYGHIRDRILRNTDAVGAFAGRSQTGGRLNVLRALNAATAPEGPSVAALDPASAAAGTQVTVRGTGFGFTPGQVSFTGAGAATVLSWTDTAVAVRVPPFAATGPVTLTTAAGATSNTVTFTVVATASGQLSLNPGWNQVSFPVRQVLSAGSATLQAWDPAAQRYGTVASAAPGQGYWVEGPGSLDWTGVPNAGEVRTVALQAGWNLVGLPTGSPVSSTALTVGGVPLPAAVSAETTQPSGTATRLFRYAFEWQSGAYKSLDLASGANLQPGRSYWIWSWAADTLGF